MAVPITTMNKENASQLGTHYSIIFQQLGGWNPKHICDFEQCFQRNTPNRPRSFYLAKEIQALANLLGKDFLCIACLFAVVSDLQAKIAKNYLLPCRQEIAFHIILSYGFTPFSRRMC